MADIQRYALMDQPAEMDPDPNGEWVKFSDLQAQPVLFYAFKHNRGNGKVAWTFHTPEEYATAYRDTCLEIIPLVARVYHAT